MRLCRPSLQVDIPLRFDPADLLFGEDLFDDPIAAPHLPALLIPSNFDLTYLFRSLRLCRSQLAPPPSSIFRVRHHTPLSLIYLFSDAVECYLLLCMAIYLGETFCSYISIGNNSNFEVRDIIIKDVKGNDVDLSTYKGNVLLIVNVASQCGLTNSNYTELTKLYENYKNEGLEILAFSCNQFGSHEPGSNEEIEQFACTRFKAECPIFDKILCYLG